jgi:hypothetical protein
LGVGGLLLGGTPVLPEWHTFFWFAFGTFIALNGTTPTDVGTEVAAI